MKWTIGMVNCKSAVYIPFHLEGFRKFNNNFQFIIIDNSRPHERDALGTLAGDNVKIIYNQPKHWSAGSGQHGDALTDILKQTETEFLLLHDPDFFWVKKGILKWLEGFLLEGNVVAGAPYPHEPGGFPTAFGSAYNVEKIKNLDFSAECQTTGDAFPNKDTGWKIREAHKNNKFFSLDVMPKSQDFIKLVAGHGRASTGEKTNP